MKLYEIVALVLEEEMPKEIAVDLIMESCGPEVVADLYQVYHDLTDCSKEAGAQRRAAYERQDWSAFGWHNYAANVLTRQWLLAMELWIALPESW